MGASVWDYRVPFQTRIEDAFVTLQERLITSGDYHWDEARAGSRPQSRKQLSEIRAEEDFWEWGTHSILDIERVVPPELRDLSGTIRALSWAELRDLLGTEQPTWKEFEAAFADGRGPIVTSVARWSGRCTVLYDDDGPVEYVFWGVSGA